MGVKITDLGLAALPLVGTELLELAVSDQESRRVSVDDLVASVGGLDATFVTVTANVDLPNERILTAGTGISIVDSGAGLPVTITNTQPGVPGGVDTNIQYNNAGAFGGDARFLWDGSIFSVLSPALTGSITLDWRTEFNPRLSFTKTGAAAEIVHPGQLNLFTNAVNTFRLYGGLTTLAENLTITYDQIRGTINTSNGGGELRVFADNGTEDIRFQFGSGLAIGEKAAAHASLATYGQVWVRDDVPNVLMYTDDAGTDYPIGGVGSDTPALNTFNYNFDTSIVMADPGTGNFRFNNVSPNLATQMTISHTDADGNDLSTAWIDDFLNGWQVFFGDFSSPDNRKGYSINATPNDFGTYTRVDLIPLANTGPGSVPADAAICRLWMGTQVFNERGTTNSGMGTLAVWEGTRYGPGVSVVSIKLGATLDYALQFNSGANSPTRLNAWIGGRIDNTETQILFIESSGSNGLGLVADYTGTDIIKWQVNGATDIAGYNLNGTTFFLPTYHVERAAAGSDFAGVGQVWVRDDVPNILMFTDDVGTDFEISSAGGTLPVGTLSGNQKDILYWGGSGWLASGSSLRVNQSNPPIGGRLRLAGGSSSLVTNAQIYVDVGNAVSTLWYMENGSDGFFCRNDNISGNDFISWEHTITGETFRIGTSGSGPTFVMASATRFYIEEKTVAASAGAGSGQFWVRDDAPNTPMFTDDAGTDFVLNAGATPPIILLDNEQIRFGTGNDVQMSFDGTNFLVEAAAAFTDFQLRDGMELRIYDTTNTHIIELRSNGTNAVFGVNSGQINVTSDFSLTDNTEINFGASDDLAIFSNGTDMQMVGLAPANMLVTGFDQWRMDMPLGMNENASPDVNLAGVGQWWVRSSAPNRPTFTDDTDVDQLLDPSISETNVQNGNYTFLITDKGKTIAKQSGGAGETYTIPASGAVAYQIGTWIAIDNDGGGDLTIAITTDVLVGTDGVTGSRTLGDNQRALIQLIAAARWRYQASDL